MDVYGTKGAGVHLEKCVYSLATHLATLIGQVEHQRPVLESVFHRLLVSPPPSARLEAVRSVHHLVAQQEAVLDLAGPPHMAGDDMALVIM